MKTNGLSKGGLLILLTTVSVSCQKEVEPITGAIGSARYQNGPEPIDTFHNNGNPEGVEGVDYGCWGNPVDCLPTAEINGYDADEMEEVFETVEAGNREAIADVFEEHEGVLGTYLEDAHIDRVIDGSAIANYRWGTGSSTHYLVVRQSSGQQTVLGAYPLVD